MHWVQDLKEQGATESIPKTLPGHLRLLCEDGPPFSVKSQTVTICGYVVLKVPTPQFCCRSIEKLRL